MSHIKDIRAPVSEVWMFQPHLISHREEEMTEDWQVVTVLHAHLTITQQDFFIYKLTCAHNKDSW